MPDFNSESVGLVSTFHSLYTRVIRAILKMYCAFYLLFIVLVFSPIPLPGTTPHTYSEVTALV